MELFSPQIPLQLEPRQRLRFDDFVPGPNQAVVDALKSVPSEEGATVFISGPEASGKTHLLNALCYASRSAGLSAFYLGLKHLPDDGHASLEGLEAMQVLCLDDVQQVLGQPEWEEALFHLINRLNRTGGRLVITSNERLSLLNIELPDLASRLGWGLRLKLEPLDDGQKIQVMHGRAEALGIALSEEVVSYLLRHGSRDIHTLLGAVERLQQAAFTEKRQVTVPLARRVLGLR